VHYVCGQLTHYQTLGVSSDAKHDAIRAAFRSLAVKHHPDKGGDPLLFQAIQEAYEVLSDETKRREYNAAFRRKPVESLLATASRMVDEYLAAC
jgi:curved DNA-binding protein CbpA